MRRRFKALHPLDRGCGGGAAPAVEWASRGGVEAMYACFGCGRGGMFWGAVPFLRWSRMLLSLHLKGRGGGGES
jgi:hypothetical protein